ncbi:uncharacterized protein LOC106868168 [Octopus bimaculoides]|uniref:uncharacterized protein LOC106868168 n=1 Tax=Octopus bimaculoides TaxID=37653 RepID=UPI00071C4C78|nr:uncharacterized protein LOC106868168 [Octopus bimaculoides]|eukprot:XP_014768799.1 PREDICTED: uncharacterized protein LOC106868168 [Octopus bimaculoides]
MPVPPSLIIVKAKQITVELSISENDFKASWQWLNRVRHGLQNVLLHGKGAEMNKEDPELLAALNDLYAVMEQYDAEDVYSMFINIYIMFITAIVFRLLPRYTLLMPYEEVNTTRGKKKAKERISHCLCKCHRIAQSSLHISLKIQRAGLYQESGMTSEVL